MSINLNYLYSQSGLSSDGQEVLNRDQFFNTLEDFQNHPENAIQKPALVDRIFTILENNCPKNDKIQKQADQILKTWIKVSFGEEHKYVPKTQLLEKCGPTFKAMLSHQMKELRENHIFLSPPALFEKDNVAENFFSNFLLYLQSGNPSVIKFNEDILIMLQLAMYYELGELIYHCEFLIIINLDQENYSDIQDFAKENDLPTLKAACHLFENNFLESKIDADVSTSPLGNRRYIFKTIGLDAIQKLKSLNTLHSNNPPTALHFSALSREQLTLFLQLIAHSFKNIKEIIIDCEDFKIDDLKLIKELFPTLKDFGNRGKFLHSNQDLIDYLNYFSSSNADALENDKLVLRSINLHGLTLSTNEKETLSIYLPDLIEIGTHDKAFLMNAYQPNKSVKMIHCRNCDPLTVAMLTQGFEFKKSLELPVFYDGELNDFLLFHGSNGTHTLV